MQTSQEYSQSHSATSLQKVSLAWLTTDRTVIVLQLLFTLFLASKLNVWLDEAYALDTTGRGLAYAFSRSLSFELQPPLYFVLMSLWRKLNSSIFFARLPSVFLIALSIKIAAALSQRYLREINKNWVLIVIATNPFMIWAAVEIRVYALAILWSALLLLFFYDGFLGATTRSRSRWYYIIVSVLGLYTQYYIGFLLLANACALLLLRRWRLLMKYLLGMGLVAICMSPLLVTVFHQVVAHVSPHTSYALGPVSVFDSMASIYWTIQEYLLRVAWNPLYFWRRWVLRLLFPTLLVLLIKRYRAGVAVEKLALWISVGVMIFCFVVLLRYTSEQVVQARHTAALFFPLTLSILALLVVGKHQRLLASWVLLVLFFNATSLYSIYSPLAKPGDWSRVASYISSVEGRQHPIMVCHAMSTLALGHHYYGKNRILPIPKENPLAMPYGTATSLTEDEIKVAFADTSASSEVWLVTDWMHGFAGSDIDEPILREFVEQNYTIESRKAFYLSKVFLLHRKPSSLVY